MNPPIFRERFPILERLTYLCSHSLGAVPSATEQNLARYYQEWATMGISAWDGPWWNAVEEFSELIAQILGAEPRTVVPMQNVTRGMAAVASCFDYQKRSKILIPELEFTTTFPFWRRQEALGARIVVVKSDDGISMDTQKLVDAIDEETLLVISSHAYFRSGALQDLQAVGRAAHARGALFLADGYQTAGAVPVNLKEMEVDFYVGGSHKWLCGGPGAGYLYICPSLVDKLQPRLTGWFGLAEPFAYETGDGPGRMHEGVHRFLGGTPNVPGLYAAREGLRTVLEAGVDNIRARSQQMTEQIVAQVDERGFALRSPRQPEKRNGMICFDFPGARDVCKAMEKKAVLADWRPDCGIRVSPHFYNSGEDLERFFQVLDAVRESDLSLRHS